MKYEICLTPQTNESFHKLCGTLLTNEALRALAIAHHQIEFESKALGVTVKDADSFFAAEGFDRGISHSMRLLCDIKEKNKNILDFLIYRCSTFEQKSLWKG